MNAIAEQTFANQGFVVLTVRPPRATASRVGFRRRRPFARSRTRATSTTGSPRDPRVDKAHVGAFGISLGGGVVLGALKAGVPFAAAEVLETWVDLYQALAPGRSDQVGAIFQFLSSVARRPHGARAEQR